MTSVVSGADSPLSDSDARSSIPELSNQRVMISLIKWVCNHILNQFNAKFERAYADIDYVKGIFNLADIAYECRKAIAEEKYTDNIFFDLIKIIDDFILPKFRYIPSANEYEKFHDNIRIIYDNIDLDGFIKFTGSLITFLTDVYIQITKENGPPNDVDKLTELMEVLLRREIGALSGTTITPTLGKTHVNVSTSINITTTHKDSITKLADTFRLNARDYDIIHCSDKIDILEWRIRQAKDMSKKRVVYVCEYHHEQLKGAEYTPRAFMNIGGGQYIYFYF